MHPETISDSLWELLRKLNNIPEMKFAYLAGGTGLALQIGHRKSEDLDFYVPREFDFHSFKRDILNIGLDAIVVNLTRLHMELMIQCLKVDFINEIIPLKFPLKPLHKDIQSIRITDPRDIGRMKILAIASRGSKRDFVDLYCLTRKSISLKSLINLSMEEHQGVRYNKLLFLKGLVDFEEADKEADPVMILDIQWEDVKNTLKKEVLKIAESIPGYNDCDKKN